MNENDIEFVAVEGEGREIRLAHALGFACALLGSSPYEVRKEFGVLKMEDHKGSLSVTIDELFVIWEDDRAVIEGAFVRAWRSVNEDGVEFIYVPSEEARI